MKRKFQKIKGLPGVYDILIFCPKSGKFIPNPTGARIRVRKGGKQRTERTFLKSELGDALVWQRGFEVDKPEIPKPFLAERDLDWLWLEFRRIRFPSIQETTQVRYENMMAKYYEPLQNVPISDFIPQTIDDWLNWLTDPKGRFFKSPKRLSFKHELDLLSTLLRFYVEQFDDHDFVYPIKRRHKKRVKLNRPQKASPKDISPSELQAFCQELEKLRYGKILSLMAQVAYYQALRVSEVCGLRHVDISLDRGSPNLSTMRISQRVVFPRREGSKPYIKKGFKNSNSQNGEKVQPVFPMTYLALKDIWTPRSTDLVFSVDGSPFTYRQVQYAYNKAFKRAGLPYTSTHVMRHGGCSYVYNQFPDLEVAKQLLGNSSVQSTLVYAKRSANAVFDVANKLWQNDSFE